MFVARDNFRDRVLDPASPHLQASLRGLTISGAVDLAGLMTNLNRLVFDASPSNKYAIFFYSQYDPTTRVMYVNGGHNPPMILRGAQILRLEDGGPTRPMMSSARSA